MMAEVLILQESLVKSFLLMQKNNLRSQHIKQKKKKNLQEYVFKSEISHVFGTKAETMLSVNEHHSLENTTYLPHTNPKYKQMATFCFSLLLGRKLLPASRQGISPLLHLCFPGLRR